MASLISRPYHSQNYCQCHRFKRKSFLDRKQNERGVPCMYAWDEINCRYTFTISTVERKCMDINIISYIAMLVSM